MSALFATAITKNELQKTIKFIKSELTEKGFNPKLSILQDTVSNFISGRKWSSLLSDFGDGIQFFQSEFKDLDDESIESETLLLLRHELPLWKIELVDDGESLNFQYDGQYQPQPAYLEINFGSKSISANYSMEIGGGVPSDVFNGVKHRAYIDPRLTSESINEILLDETILRKVTEIDRLGEIDWNGSNWSWLFKEGVDSEANRDVWIELDELFSDMCIDAKKTYVLDENDVEEQEELLAKLKLDGTNTEEIKALIVEAFEDGTSDEIDDSNIDLDYYLHFESMRGMPDDLDDYFYKIVDGVVYRSEDESDGFEDIHSFGEHNFSGLQETIGDLVKSPFLSKNAIEDLASQWLQITGKLIEDTSFLDLKGLGSFLAGELSSEANDYYLEISCHETKSGHTELLEFTPSFEEIEKLIECELASVIEVDEDGYRMIDVQGLEFVVSPGFNVNTRHSIDNFPFKDGLSN